MSRIMKTMTVEQAAEILRKRSTHEFDKISFDKGASAELCGEWRLKDIQAAIAFIQYGCRGFFDDRYDEGTPLNEIPVKGAIHLLEVPHGGMINSLSRGEDGRVWISGRWKLDYLKALYVVLKYAMDQYSARGADQTDCWEHYNSTTGELPELMIAYPRGCTPSIQVVDESPYYTTAADVPRESDESPTNA